MQKKDLFVLVEGKDDMAILSAVLERYKSLRIRRITYEIRAHPQRVSGIIKAGVDVLRNLRSQYERFICLFDHQGSGWEDETPEEILQEVQESLDRNTFEGIAATIIIVPELEAWLWQKPFWIDKVLGINEAERQKLLENWRTAELKSSNITIEETLTNYPKEAFEFLLRAKRIVRSSSLYEQIATQAGLKHWANCPSFAKLQQTLQEWFPPR